MELISEYFSWYKGGRKSSTDPGYRVSSGASEGEEEETTVRIRANGKNEDHCIRGRRRRRRRSSCQNQGKWERMTYIYMESFLTFK